MKLTKNKKILQIKSEKLIIGEREQEIKCSSFVEN